VTGVVGGKPVLADGTVADVENVIWCTGFTPGLDWVRMPILDEHGEPRHERGVVLEEPGLFFVGLHFLTSMSSAMVHGVGHDAARIAALVRARSDTAAAERNGGPLQTSEGSAVAGLKASA
jgi:putative flavoprotein involved in K+ transport